MGGGVSVGYLTTDSTDWKQITRIPKSGFERKGAKRREVGAFFLLIRSAWSKESFTV